MPTKHRVVVVGGGFGGLHAVQSLKNAPVHVTLLDRRNFHLFQPLLYEVATGTLSTGNIAASLRHTLKRQKNAQVLLGEMIDIDPLARHVILPDGTLSYDTLILAPGSQPYYLRHDEWRTHAPGLKTVEDAIAVRSRILRAFESAERETDPQRVREWLTFVIVGAGPTGVELAGALSEVARKTLLNDFRRIHPEDARIILVSGDDRVLREFPPDLSAKAETALKRLKVIVRHNLLVTDVQPDAVLLGNPPQQERIAARTILWAAGVRASPLGDVVAQATGASLDKEGRLKVAANLSLPGRPDIFVIGDLAFLSQDGKPLPGIAPVAIQQGRYVADVIDCRLRGEEVAPFRYHHRGNLATVGRNRAVADLGWIRFNGTLAWLAWIIVHLIHIVEFEDRLLVFMQWIWSYLTWNRSDLLITYTVPPVSATPSPERRLSEEVFES